MMYGLGVPVVMGPLSGAMDYPPALQYMQSRVAWLVDRGGRVRADPLMLPRDPR